VAVDAFLVSIKRREALFLGKVLQNEDGSFRCFAYPDDDVDVMPAITRFMLDHLLHDVRLMTDIDFYTMDLTGFVRSNNEYGLPFRGLRNFTDG